MRSVIKNLILFIDVTFSRHSTFQVQHEVEDILSQFDLMMISKLLMNLEIPTGTSP